MQSDLQAIKSKLMNISQPELMKTDSFTARNNNTPHIRPQFEPRQYNRPNNRSQNYYNLFSNLAIVNNDKTVVTSTNIPTHVTNAISSPSSLSHYLGNSQQLGCNFKMNYIKLDKFTGDSSVHFKSGLIFTRFLMLRLLRS